MNKIHFTVNILIDVQSLLYSKIDIRENIIKHYDLHDGFVTTIEHTILRMCRENGGPEKCVEEAFKALSGDEFVNFLTWDCNEVKSIKDFRLHNEAEKIYIPIGIQCEFDAEKFITECYAGNVYFTVDLYVDIQVLLERALNIRNSLVGYFNGFFNEGGACMYDILSGVDVFRVEQSRNKSVSDFLSGFDAFCTKENINYSNAKAVFDGLSGDDFMEYITFDESVETVPCRSHMVLRCCVVRVKCCFDAKAFISAYPAEA